MERVHRVAAIAFSGSLQCNRSNSVLDSMTTMNMVILDKMEEVENDSYSTMVNASDRIKNIKTQVNMLSAVIESEMQKWEDLEIDAQVKLPNSNLPNGQEWIFDSNITRNME